MHFLTDSFFDVLRTTRKYFTDIMKPPVAGYIRAAKFRPLLGTKGCQGWVFIVPRGFGLLGLAPCTTSKGGRVQIINRTVSYK